MQRSQTAVAACIRACSIAPGRTLPVVEVVTRGCGDTLGSKDWPWHCRRDEGQVDAQDVGRRQPPGARTRGPYSDEARRIAGQARSMTRVRWVMEPWETGGGGGVGSGGVCDGRASASRQRRTSPRGVDMDSLSPLPQVVVVKGGPGREMVADAAVAHPKQPRAGRRLAKRATLHCCCVARHPRACH